MSQLIFRFSAMALFEDALQERTELRVVIVDADSMAEAINTADSMMIKYAEDFGLSYSGRVNVFEAGSDMTEEYGEIFSVNWVSSQSVSDSISEVLFEDTL